MSGDEAQDRDDHSPVIVAIIGSGGLTASLDLLLESLPPRGDAAMVVVLQHREALDEEGFRRAARRGGRDVTLIEDGAPLEAGRLYLPPADVIVTLDGGRFRMHRSEQAPGGRGTIDSFLVSLAEQRADQAILVALAGADGDGTLGAQEVKRTGGGVLAEDTDESRADALAQSDSPAALADAVLPVEELARRLPMLIEELAGGSSVQAALAPSASEVREALAAIAQLLRQKTGHDFHGYKPGTFLRRVQRRMQALLLDDLPGYIEALRSRPDEAQSLFNDLLIGVTEFFRDGREWEILEREVVPRLFDGKAAADTVRAWVVGCSTGEEAYSLAILLAEQRARRDDPPHVQIFASDLDGRALAAARTGRYTDRIVPQLTPERLARWFVREGDTYHIAKELREMCLFSQHSLIRDAPFSRLDMVSCRNLLIYLDGELQARILPLFHFALRPGGFLFLGNSENVSRHPDLFRAVEPRSRAFRRLDAATRPLLDFPFTATDRRALAGREAVRADASIGTARPPGGDPIRWAERVMERYTPASVVVDANHTVLHFSGRVERYLAPSRGAASLDLLQLVSPDLRPSLRAALGRALEERRTITVDGLEVGTDEQRVGVDLVVEPELRNGAPASALVVFRDRKPRPMPGDTEGEGPSIDQDERFWRLQAELGVTRDRLQGTIEELETTNEELKSSNEEYQSLNEEMQSANEELETSKEELQSVNEELTTVNGELAHRVQELGRANSDLKNFLESTQIATLFLGNDLQVTNYTPAIAELFHMVESDLGRPIAHIKSRIAYDELQDDARRVLRTLAPAEREIAAADGSARYLVRVLPYRSTDNFIAGVVVTFVDVTARRQMEERLRVLVGELQHRTRNLMAVVLGVMRRTHQDSPDIERFVADFESRLEALARVNGLLSRLHMDDRVTFDELIRAELSAHGAVDGDGLGPRVTLDGPQGVRLRSSTVQTLALALHELATNAGKYGALAQPDGHLTVRWRRTRQAEKLGLVIRWIEAGVAMPDPGAAAQGGGYGRELIERALPYQLGAATTYELGPDGVRCTIEMPLSSREAGHA